MRQAMAVALVSSIGLTATCSSPVAAAAMCESAKIHPGALNVTLNSGDTSVVKVVGYAGKKPAVPPPPDLNFHVKAGVPYALTAGDMTKPDTTTTIKIASNLTANIVVDPSPKPPGSGTDTSSSASPTESPAPGATSPTTHPGGDDNKLSATIKDERYASFSASPAPAPSPGAASDGSAPVVEYTIKGQHPGDTALVVAQGGECVAIGIHVRPGITDRFFTSAGVAMSTVPEYSIKTTAVPTGTLVYKTEDSGHRVAVPLLFNYRITDNAHVNLYGTVGFFANSSSSGLVYGVSLAREHYLLTFGAHSEKVTDFASGVHNNDVVPTGGNTMISRRITSGFLAVTFATSFLTQLLGGGAPSTGSGSSATGGTTTTSSH